MRKSEKRGITRKWIWIFVTAVCVFMVTGFLFWQNAKSKKQQKQTVTIAVFQDDQVQNFNTNYYTEWLEKQSGYDLKFCYIPEGYEKEYLSTMLNSDNNTIDAVFLPKERNVFKAEEWDAYVKEGLIQNLADYMTEDCNLNRLFMQYADYGLYEQMKAGNGIYYMPNMDTARKTQNMQILWINMKWLKKLDLQIPKTTTELVQVLEAFRDKDPNGNGERDELPLISCDISYPMQSYNYLLNAFIYNDPVNGRLYLDKEGNLKNASKEEAFRQGLLYCNELYTTGLLAGECFSYTSRQIRELVNAPEDLVGAFTSKSIADVIYANCPDRLAKFIQVPPLTGETGETYAVWVNYVPQIGGYIPSNSKHSEAAFQVMDLMLSEEASLIAEFGEEGVDWKHSEQVDLSTYGTKAYITTIRYLKDSIQNKNYAGTGPQVLSEAYANGVTWNGNNSLVEYIDARAVRTYEEFYYYKENISGRLSEEKKETQKELSEFTDQWIGDFITGTLDVRNDAVWQQYLKYINESEGK